MSQISFGFGTTDSIEGLVGIGSSTAAAPCLRRGSFRGALPPTADLSATVTEAGAEAGAQSKSEAESEAEAGSACANA